MVTISVCMIVKNEEDTLGRCLDCAKQIADEIIIVDTGSNDATKNIAQAYTNKIYDFEWCDDFAKARNYSFSKATMQYCMWLDADDIILDKDIEKIKLLKQQLLLSTNIVMMKYHTAFDSEGNPTFSYFRERIILRNSGLMWEGVIHEVIPLIGAMIYEDIAITHQKIHASDPNRNIRIFEGLLKNGKMLNPREQFYYARELYYHKRYQDAIQTFTCFLDEGHGWIENNIDACEIMAYSYYMLGKEHEALISLYKSFIYDLPRAELCCDIGKHYFDKEQYGKALFWYELAMTRPRNDASGAFIREDCYGYLPCIQLCVCYYKLEDIKKSQEYNTKASVYKPNSAQVIKNQEFFMKIIK